MLAKKILTVRSTYIACASALVALLDRRATSAVTASAAILFMVTPSVRDREKGEAPLSALEPVVGVEGGDRYQSEA